MKSRNLWNNISASGYPLEAGSNCGPLRGARGTGERRWGTRGRKREGSAGKVPGGIAVYINIAPRSKHYVNIIVA